MAGVTDSSQALAGVTVLDLATFLAAPLCATLLGEFGADVIKVEQPGVGDDLRRLGPAAGGSGRSSWLLVEARHQKTITRNPRDPPGQALLRRPVASAARVALRHAERTGQGQVVDLGLYEPVLRILDDAVAVFGATGQVRERIGSGTESAVPHNHYRSRDGRWIAIACTNDRMFARLLQALGRPELEGDPRMASVRARLAHREAVDELVAAWVAAREAAEALRVLEAAEVPSSLVASVRDLFEDPQVRARENILRLVVPLVGALAMPGVVPRLTRTPGRVDRAGPTTLGEHNEEVYGGRLGLSQTELARLRARGVI